jgi:hypothetical protein
MYVEMAFQLNLYQHIAHNPIKGATDPHLIIGDDDDESIVNIFAFGAFADKNNCIVYHDLMGSFLFMSLDGSGCFFVLYHYKPAPIAGLDDVSIFTAYEMQCVERFYTQIKCDGQSSNKAYQEISYRIQVQIAAR